MAHGTWREFLSGILIVCLGLGSVPILTSTACADRPCANSLPLPEEYPISAEVCIDDWLAANNQVHSLLFGPGSQFSTQSPLYTLFSPVVALGYKKARTASGINFSIDVLEFIPTEFDAPGGMVYLPAGAAETIANHEISGGIVFADMVRGTTAVAVMAMYFSVRPDDGAMTHALLVIKTLPFELAEGLRAARTLSDPGTFPPPLVPPEEGCWIDCDGDGVVDSDIPSFCGAQQQLNTDYLACRATKLDSLKNCLRIQLGFMVFLYAACMVGCAVAPPSCVYCLLSLPATAAGIGVACYAIEQDLRNCYTEYLTRLDAAVRQACESVNP